MVDLNNIPSFDQLPKFHDQTGCAWDVWGRDDQLGTVNLLTEDVSLQNYRLGKMVCLNWPINFPEKPAFSRQTPVIHSWKKGDHVNDDSISINTQSGSQWDGLKHFGVEAQKVFYQNTPTDFFFRGQFHIGDPSNIDQERIKYGIHNWSQHGICGRGVLIDLVSYYEKNKGALPYDPWTTHPIPLQDILDCAKSQGVTFEQADILLLRVGFIQKYNSTTQETRDSLCRKPETFAGIEQTEDMKRFLWSAVLLLLLSVGITDSIGDRDNHFAAIASDQPALERWPPPAGTPHLHQTLLPLWGMPIGEFFDLEKLSTTCKETGRYTFFFSSWPLNILGGVASPPNAAAYF
ncbi:hypothetical protein NLI96_g10931 [Meripilus lineatus]|uniref:Cyclase n=1 Tax=Meripilus lineatus TaxID=2056292 RepID=A0AAD5UT12_9APHY|nr:hypothetical protein NLI96_g10931 [Physisporinus lineatus]